jgi:glycosyltransferase involved in cell wall biosynthesis
MDTGIAHQSVWLTRRVTPIRDIIALVQLIFIILNFKPDIVHTHTPKAGIIGMLAAWICRLPVRLHTIAGLPWINQTGMGRWVLTRVEKLTYACAHRVYPNSNNLFQFLKEELSFSSSKTKVIGKGSSNGIDVHIFKRDDVLNSYGAGIRERYNIPKQDLVFSFVGRIVKDKGIVELIDAFAEVSKAQSASLILVGDFEPELDPLPAHTLAMLKANPKIIMPGFQQDVRPWLVASDVFVFPSHREGFPNGVMQACCLELPVIATDINGCNEIIQNNFSGILIPVNNLDVLQKAMIQLANDSQLRIEMGKRGREYVVQNFSQQYVWGEILKEYNLMDQSS